MPKYFAISFCSHAILLALLFSASVEADRDKTQHYDQDNTVIDMIPIIPSAVFVDNAAPREVALDPHESTLSNTQNEKYDLSSTITNTNQILKMHNHDKNVSVIATSEDNERSPKTEPILPTSDSPTTQKFESAKTPTFAETKVARMAKIQTVPYEKILTPTPKPRAKANLHIKDFAGENTVETSNSPKPKYPLTRNLQQQNTARTKLTKKAILKFNNEFMSPLDSPKNAQFATKITPMQNNNNNPLISSNPNFTTDKAKHQCRLLSRQNARVETNIHEIQKKIRLRGITISNILDQRSQQKINEMTISSLLASELNGSSYTHRKASDNIGFLLTTNSFQDYAQDLVCMSN